jgi:4-deoxy-L-threo-5-hexosulose-uronate ketol-isomerase
MKIIQHVHSEDFKTYQTDKIRERFLLDGLKEKDKANFVYAHYDRMVTGLITPITTVVPLGTYDILRADFFLERREMGIINVGGNGKIEADGTSYELAKLDCLYLGKGVKALTLINRPYFIFYRPLPIILIPRLS